MADSSATLRPRPGYVPKVPTTPFRDQEVNLQALPLEEADPDLALLCSVHTLQKYMDRTQSLRTSEQLFVCYGGQQKGKAVSKQRMAHWIVDAITLAYEAQGVPCLLRLRAHSTRGVASSWALARGASLANICRAAGWATPNTFASSIAYVSNRFPPVFSPQTGSGTERPCLESACCVLNALFSREFPNWANPVESSSTPASRRGGASAPGLSDNEFLKSGVRLVPI